MLVITFNLAVNTAYIYIYMYIMTFRYRHPTRSGRVTLVSIIHIMIGCQLDETQVVPGDHQQTTARWDASRSWWPPTNNMYDWSVCFALACTFLNVFLLEIRLPTYLPAGTYPLEVRHFWCKTIFFKLFSEFLLEPPLASSRLTWISPPTWHAPSVFYSGNIIQVRVFL